MKNAMRTYLNIEEVSSLDDSPSFVCDVLLNECKLVISKYEVAVSANVTATIIEELQVKLCGKILNMERFLLNLITM